MINDECCCCCGIINANDIRHKKYMNKSTVLKKKMVYTSVLL